MDDDLIRRALGGGDALQAPSAMFDRALAAGAVRRRRRAAALGAVAALTTAAVVAGAVLAGRGDDGSVVGVGTVAPSTTDQRSSDTPGSPTTGVARTTTPVVSAPILATTTSTTATGTTTASTTSTTSAVPATTHAKGTTTTSNPDEQAEVSCPSDPEFTVRMVLVDTTGAAPGASEVFFTGAIDRPGAIELRTSAGRVAAIDDSVEAEPGCSYLTPHDYAGRWAWLSVGDTACGSCEQPSRVFRIDVVTGEVAEMWSAADARRVFDLTAADDGTATLVAGPSDVTAYLSVFDLGRPGGPVVRADWPVDPATTTSARIDPSTNRLAYTVAMPQAGHSELHVLDEQGSDAVFSLVGIMAWPQVQGWEPGGGGRLIVQDLWEDVWTATLDLTAPFPIDTVTPVGAAACWLGGGELAVATWHHSYAEGPPERGRIEVRDRSGSAVADTGVDLIGNELACLAGRRVVTVDYTIVPQGVTDPSRVLVTQVGVTPVVVDATYVYRRDA